MFIHAVNSKFQYSTVLFRVFFFICVFVSWYISVFVNFFPSVVEIDLSYPWNLNQLQ